MSIFSCCCKLLWDDQSEQSSEPWLVSQSMSLANHGIMLRLSALLGHLGGSG